MRESLYNTFKEVLEDVKKTDAYFKISTMTWAEAKTKSNAEIKLYAKFGEVEPEYLKQLYREYKTTINEMSYEGKMFIVRPYSSLAEAVMDGIIANNAAGMEAVWQQPDSDEVVLCVRHSSSPDKTFGYVKYTREGELITCRSLCNIELENPSIRSFFVKFGLHIVAKVTNKQEVNEEESKAV